MWHFCDWIFAIIKLTKGKTLMRKELLKGLTDEQIAKVKACEDTRDLLQLAIDEGVELNEEQLNAVNGGACTNAETDKKRIIES